MRQAWVSFGVQDTSWEVQEAIGRRQKQEATFAFFELCRAKGFTSINLDLVYGLPRQTPERFAGTLRDALAMRPERLAVFGYAHVPWVRPHQGAIDPATLPGAEERLELLLLAHRELTAAGYRHMGLDHFALPDDDLARAQDEGRLSRSFMGYSARPAGALIGLGVSAIGDLGDTYVQNEKKLAHYFSRIGEGKLPVERGFACSKDDLARRHVIGELLCNLRASGDEFLSRFQVPFWTYFAPERQALLELEGDGLIHLAPQGLAVTEEGGWFLRSIAMAFDRYLRLEPAGAAAYSRVI
jgi:oxygen-independent coproporphyrinogen-3 oxidase